MRALGELVAREEQAGNLLGAAGWAQRASALAPGDEGWVRRAMTLLDEGGDTGGALRFMRPRPGGGGVRRDGGETLALASRIKEERGSRPRPSVWARPPTRRPCRPRR